MGLHVRSPDRDENCAIKSGARARSQAGRLSRSAVTGPAIRGHGSLRMCDIRPAQLDLRAPSRTAATLEPAGGVTDSGASIAGDPGAATPSRRGSPLRGIPRSRPTNRSGLDCRMGTIAGASRRPRPSRHTQTRIVVGHANSAYRAVQPRDELTPLLHCSHCRFAFRPRSLYLWLDYCPRCLAKAPHGRAAAARRGRRLAAAKRRDQARSPVCALAR